MSTQIAEWITQHDAAQLLAVAEKTLVRWSEQGKLERRMRPRAGKVPEPVYEPAQIAALKTERNAPLLPAIVPPAPQVKTKPPAEDLDRFAHRLASLAQLFPPPAECAYLTIEQASRVCGLSQAFLRRAVRSKLLPSIRDRAVKVQRRHLDSMDVGKIMSKLSAMR